VIIRAIVTLVVITACHSAAVVVEHRGAGGGDSDHQFTPVLGTDGHYISFPSHPFVNCLDVLRFDQDSRDHRNIPFDHPDPRSVPCSDSADYVDFVGYRSDEPGAQVSWISKATDLRWDLGMNAIAMAANLGPQELTAPVAELSFLHFSDVQIREPAAKLTNASEQLDKIIGTFQRDYEQELYSRYTYAAIVDTVNAELSLPRRPSRPPPSFMVHTGDSVDAGLKSEFDEFIVNSNRLRVPWYQVVGNHDVLAFGNLRLYSRSELKSGAPSDEGVSVAGDADCSVGDELCSCTQVADLLRDLEYPKDYDNLGRPIPISSSRALVSVVPGLVRRICIRHRVRNDRFIMDPSDRRAGSGPGSETTLRAVNAFMSAHCLGTSSGECIGHDLADGMRYAAKPVSGAPCGTLAGNDGQRSVMHGFDLAPGMPTDRVSGAAAESIRRSAVVSKAYYCFEAGSLADGRRLWSVVLDTNAKNGAYGDVSNAQLEWLDGVLKSQQIASSDLIVVFGHHPLGHMFSVERRERLITMLTGTNRVIGYFAGHTHQPELRVIHGGERTHHFWEIVAPSVISFPQQVRQVTLKTMGDKLGYFEILTFAPNGRGASVSKIAAALAGAQRDTCSGNPDCENGVPKLVSKTTTYPRLFFKLPDRAPGE
jgi:3',5'-cyclic AMP phosphodiesterase CpdA